MEFSLKGYQALVCGASQGIGRATAQAFAAKGARVLALARDAGELQELISSLPNHSGNPHASLVMDLKDLDRLQASLQEMLKSWGPIQILVCNTGGPKAGPLLEASDEEFLQAFKLHVLANQRLAKMLVPGMKQVAYGRIINIISTSVKAPIHNLGVSNTIRAAVASWAKTLANELGPMGITVNNVLPGYTSTTRLKALIENAAKLSGKEIEQVEAEWRASVPLRRFADPAETAEVISFLASPQAGYIHGINLPVDGGRTPSL